MMRALFSGVTGLRAHQTKMDVIGNNIANVNTTGFKRSTVTFADLFSETTSGASGAQGEIGGINAQQIGLGAMVGAIAMNHNPGSAQYTGNPLDFAIEGDGFFMVQTPEGVQFTRAGNFDVDHDGNLVTRSGYYVLGYPTAWQPGNTTGANPTYGSNVISGAFNGTPDSMVPIHIDSDTYYNVSVDGTGAVVGQTRDVTITDANGNVIARRGGDNKSFLKSMLAGGIVMTQPNPAPTPPITTLPTTDAQVDALSDENAQALVDWMTKAPVVGPPAVPGGLPANMEVIPKGIKVTLGFVGLANFSNSAGLEKVGTNLFVETANSGQAVIGQPGTAGYGKLSGSSLEMSNVDLADEMVNMIVTQRGLQANSRIITTADTILEELVNLKR